MIEFSAKLKKFRDKGEKTGWTYLEVPSEIAQRLKPGTRKSFRVRGKIDGFPISQVAMIPMGGGDFIIAVNARMRKGIARKEGAMVRLQLQEDKKEYELNPEFLDCLADEPVALEFFRSLAASHQRYFSKWIDSARTLETKTKRIAWAVSALAKKQGYGEMIRSRRNTDPL